MSVEKKETLIQVQNLTKTFGGSVHALNGVSTDIKKGEVVCIIEAMKIMNEITSEFDGIVDEILVSNEQIVEFGQTLFRIV